MIRRFFETGTTDSGGGSEFIKKRIEQVQPGGPEEKNVEANLNEGDLEEMKGKSPGDSLDGKIIAEKYGFAVQERMFGFIGVVGSLIATANVVFAGKPGRESALVLTCLQDARHFLIDIVEERGGTHIEGHNPVIQKVLDDAAKVEGPKKHNKEVFGLLEATDDFITDYSVYAENAATTSVKEYAAQTGAFQRILSARAWMKVIYNATRVS